MVNSSVNFLFFDTYTSKIDDGWYDLDELLEWSMKFIAVKIDSENWESSTCSCHYWQKNFKCKDTIGTSHFLNLNKFPGLDLAIEGNAKSALERNSIAPIYRQLDNLNQHEVQQEVSSTVLSVNYSIVNVSHQNQLFLASNSAVQDLVENNIQISEKR
ncbi:hypothetical protein BpHYR1_049480 [Brachionus plicatilis]|uniref:SWIM-type domain-containing protein n=1 Tax=Brachionus plicatilis TaxID=10195 RepID=A0A3M7RE27_BRAPC|nr:hypothetical protein BpHYR1_049480 [Brachionus plicatilis]